MGYIDFKKDVLIRCLKSYGENELAEMAESLSDDEIKSIGKMAMKHSGRVSLIDQMIALAAVEYLEKAPRELKRKKRDMSYYK